MDYRFFGYPWLSGGLKSRLLDSAVSCVFKRVPGWAMADGDAKHPALLHNAIEEPDWRSNAPKPTASRTVQAETRNRLHSDLENALKSAWQQLHIGIKSRNAAAFRKIQCVRGPEKNLWFSSESLRRRRFKKRLACCDVPSTGISSTLNARINSVVQKEITAHGGSLWFPPVANLPTVYTGELAKDRFGSPVPLNLYILTEPWRYPSKYDLVSMSSKCRFGICRWQSLRLYTVGLYIDTAYLASYTANLQKEHHSDPELLFDPQVNKTLRFFFNGNLDSLDIVKEFSGRLRQALPREESLVYNYNSGVLGVEEFRKILRHAALQKGSVLTVTLLGNPTPGRVILMCSPDTNSELEYLGQMNNIGVCFAFHNLFLLHPQTHTPPLMSSIAAQLSEGVRESAKL